MKIHRLPESIVMSVLCFCVLVAGSCTSPPPSPQGYQGTWVMKLGERVFMVLKLEEKRGVFTGTISMPAKFDLGSGKVVFSRIGTEVTQRPVAKAFVQETRLHFAVDDPKAPKEPDEFDMTITSPDHASIQWVGVPVGAWPFVRIQGATVPAVATDWDPQRTYAARNENAESNPFMRAIFDEDQRARKDQLTMSSGQWEALAKEDAARQQRTRALLASEQLHSGEDFREAAVIFQHGSTPEDFLLAHTLAMVAVSRGDDTAVWIGAATLDRYLQSIDRPQVYGTQFRNEANETKTQEPYNRTLISDSLRLELGVPPLEAQQVQLKEWQEQAEAKK